MAKTEATRQRERQGKVVTSEDVEEKDNVKTEGQTETVSSSTSEQVVGTSKVPLNEDQDEQDSQMDAVIEVKGSTSTVTVSWDETNKEGEVDAEKRTDASDQMMDSEEQIQIISSADAVSSTEDTPSEAAETKTELEMQEPEESQMDTDAGSTVTVTEILEKKNEEGASDDAQKETNGVVQKTVKKKPEKGKRKARSTVETPPSKKTKLINDGFCLFVGNLNNSKSFDEVEESLTKYFMAQSLLVQNIRLDKSKRHAFVDVASEMDLTKGLTLNGEMMHDKPLRIAKAKVKREDEVKEKEEENKKAKDGRCLFLKNLPYSATKEDIQKLFPKAVDVRFPDGTAGPTKGIAFLEFKKRSIAEKQQQQKQGVDIQGRILIVDFVGETKTKSTKASSNKTLFVSNLPFNMKEKTLKKHFQKAVSISVPKRQGQSRGFAFVEFAAAADAEKALQSSKNMIIFKRAIKVQFCKIGAKSVQTKVSRTLIVMGMAKKTTAETLKSAFEGSVRARITVDRETGVSKGFGFVDFESEDKCTAVKEAMEDCEIDGSKVTVAYAKPEGIKDPESTETPGGPAAAEGPGRGGGKGKRGKGKRGGKGRGAGTPQDAVKEVETKG